MRLPAPSPAARVRRRGYTLIEMLAAIGALLMVFGVLGHALLQGLDSVARTRAAHRSASGASMALANAMHDLGDAAVITTCGSTLVRYRRPILDSDGKYVIVPRGENPGPFTHVAPGGEVEVSFNADEGKLYRIDLEAYPPEVEVVAEGLQSVKFTYEGRDPTVETLSPWDMDSVTVELVSDGSSGNRSASETVTKTVKLRNHL